MPLGKSRRFDIEIPFYSLCWACLAGALMLCRIGQLVPVDVPPIVIFYIGIIGCVIIDAIIELRQKDPYGLSSAFVSCARAIAIMVMGGPLIAGLGFLTVYGVMQLLGISFYPD